MAAYGARCAIGGITPRYRPPFIDTRPDVKDPFPADFQIMWPSRFYTQFNRMATISARLLPRLPANWPIPNDLIQAFLLGYMSHLVADILTPSGVPFLWPLPFRFCFPLLRSKSNKRAERFIAIVLAVCACFIPVSYSFDFHSQFESIIKYIHNQIDIRMST